jgi:hypothetical protein
VGVDAPEGDQLYRRVDSFPYRDGAAAANKLDAFIAQRSVYCAPRDIDRYGRTVASSRADGEGWITHRALHLKKAAETNQRRLYSTRETFRRFRVDLRFSERNEIFGWDLNTGCVELRCVSDHDDVPFHTSSLGSVRALRLMPTYRVNSGTDA